MRKLISLILVLVLGLAAFPALAQNPPVRFSDGRPQIAYHLFSTWADNYMTNARRGKLAGESILFGTGAFALGGSAAAWFYGDEISRWAEQGPMDPALRQNLSLGLGISGGALLITGLIVASVPVKDYRAIYADVFEERDSEVQEAMAVSVLRYQADRGKERRITSFISGIALPLIAGGIKAGFNVASGERWSTGVGDMMNPFLWSTAGGVMSIFTKTEEERLYDRYLSTRDALKSADR